jgi:methylated-DNA-protein-cysteine methyltransferase related protein
MKSGRDSPPRARTKSARAIAADAKRARADAMHDDIVRVIRSIPRGVVTSYGEIAERAGWPGRSRLVGRILGEHPGDALPWFRILRAGGKSAFAPGSRGFREQARRLAAEGILLVNGRADVAAHGWDRNLDAMLWAPPSRATPSSATKNAAGSRRRR